MARSLLVFLVLFICLAQCTKTRGKGKTHESHNSHKRGKRSCHYCDEDSYHGPVYHSLQFSGLARNDDGTPQGVFSGAAAAANLGIQAGGPSYSLASSVANAGAGTADITGAGLVPGAALGTALGTGAALGAGAALGTGAAVLTAPAYGADAALRTGAALGTNAALNTGAAYGADAALGTGAAIAAAPVLGLAAAGAGAYNGVRVASQRAAYSAGRLTERSVEFEGQHPANIRQNGGNAGFGGYGQNKFDGSASYKDEHYSGQLQNGVGKNFGGQGGSDSQNLHGSNHFEGNSLGLSGYNGNEQQVQQSGFGQGQGNQHQVENFKESGQQQLQSSDRGQWQQGNKFSSSSQSSSSSGAGYGGSESGARQGGFNGANNSGFDHNGSNHFGGQSSEPLRYNGNEQQVQQLGFGHGQGNQHQVENFKENGQQQLQSSDRRQWQQGNKFSSSSQSSSSSGVGYSGLASGARQGAFNGAANINSGFDYNGSRASGFGSGGKGFPSDRTDQASIENSGFGNVGSGAIGVRGEQSSVGSNGSGYEASRDGFGSNGARPSSDNEQSSIGTNGAGFAGPGFGAAGSSAGASGEAVGAGVSESQYGGASGYQGSRLGHTALNGALNLASQGLQTGEAGCGTCGRSSYAFSNAKSKTGDAVAVSIGG